MSCNKCGYCCTKTTYEGDVSTHTDIKCGLLNGDNTCSIYETRHLWKPEYCNTIEEIKERDCFRFLPETCGYKGR